MDPVLKKIKQEIEDECEEGGDEDLENGVFLNDAQKEQLEQEEEPSEVVERGIEKKLMRDEFGVYEVSASAREEHTQSTIRLVAELFEKTGLSTSMLNSESFRNMMTHLNPAAHIPTVEDIESHSIRLDEASPTECLFCGVEEAENLTTTLPIDTAALVLTVSIMTQDRDRNEAASRILSASLRCCTEHLVECTRLIMDDLKLHPLLNYEPASFKRIDEWHTVYRIIKKRREKIDGPQLGLLMFKELLAAFVQQFPTEQSVPSVAAQPSTEPRCQAIKKTPTRRGGK